MLGPSILFASPPFCAGYAFNACVIAKAKWVARVGLVLGGLQLLALVSLMIIGLFQEGGGG